LSAVAKQQLISHQLAFAVENRLAAKMILRVHGVFSARGRGFSLIAFAKNRSGAVNQDWGNWVRSSNKSRQARDLSGRLRKR